MTVCSPISTCVKNVVRLTGCVQKQMSYQIYSVISQTPPSSSYFYLSSGNPKQEYACKFVSKTNSFSLVTGFQAFQRICFRSGISKQKSNWHSSRVKSTVSQRHPSKTRFDISLGSKRMSVRLLVPKQRMIPKIKINVGHVSWLQRCASAVLIFGSLVCYSTSEPVHAEGPHAKENKEHDCDPSSVGFSHGKKVCSDYSVIGIPGDGRCLFRSVAHGACLRSGKPAPNESLQRELADELRAKVADEFVKRRKETEWFIEGNFNTYVSQIRKPHVWGGEPELLMASHVLQMPITVYMHDQDSGGLISIAEYGQEYGKENPIKVLYHGFGHYDALLIPGKKGDRSKL